MQGVSLVFCVMALVFGGLKNPMMGFPVAIMVMLILELSTPKIEYPNKEALKMAYGSLIRGGIRRGIFIKEMFYAAILLAFVMSALKGNERFMLIYGALSLALTISTISSEIEAYNMRRIFRSEN